MIIYFSGGGVRGVWQGVNELLLRRGAARLLSFAYRPLLFAYCELAKEQGLTRRVKVMVDSGAFTAWSKGQQVNRAQLEATFQLLLDQYAHCCDFVLINLDVIPGRKGVDPTPAQLVEAQRQSEENFAHLNARFPKLVLPVFHQGESTAYYDELARESEYLCLSPRNDVAERWRIDWAQRYSHRAPRRFHGLAATGLTMMETVKWYSVDSATWVMVGGYGGIFWRGEQRMQVLTVSSSSRYRKQWDGHVDTLAPALRAHVEAAVVAKGYTLAQLREDDVERYKWNAEVWIDMTLRERHQYQEVIYG